MPCSRLVLASTSPRRAELFLALGLTPSIVAPGVPEDGREGESPPDQAARLALAKAWSVASALAEEDAVVLAADTVVALDGVAFGKPRDEDDARRMLRLLSGRTHEVFTAVHVLRAARGLEARAVEGTRVHFGAYDERTLAWYVATGEPRDKAGAYSIQGKGVLLTRGIEGSWSNVVGLPLEILPELLARVGIDLLEEARV